jgi:hypothetical protein
MEVAAAKAVAGTKIRWGKPRAGSSPAARTIFCLLDGFDGRLTSSKSSKRLRPIRHCATSQALSRAAFSPMTKGGRSTSYSLVED